MIDDEKLKNYKKVPDNIAERIEFVKGQIDQIAETSCQLKRSTETSSSLFKIQKHANNKTTFITVKDVIKEVGRQILH